MPRNYVEWTGRFKRKREFVDERSGCSSSVNCGETGVQMDQCIFYDRNERSASDTKPCMNHFTSQLWWNRKTVDLQQKCIGSLVLTQKIHYGHHKNTPAGSELH
jgi:hypothetical protein